MNIYAITKKFAFFILIALSIVCFSTVAHASHFRYGTISVSPGPVGTETFTLKVSYRRSYPFASCGGAGCSPSAMVTGNTFTSPDAFVWGDQLCCNIGTSYIFPLFTVTSYDLAQDWIEAVATFSHPYSGPGPFTAYFGYSGTDNDVDFGCCRADASGVTRYRLQTTVKPQTTNHSPTSSIAPIVRLPVSDSAHPPSFFLPASDFDGDAITFRLATSAESGLGSTNNTGAAAGTVPSVPGNPTINSTTGLVTWNTSGLSTSQFYALALMIEDHDSSGAVKSETPVDFVMQPVSAAGAAPTCLINGSAAPLPISVAPNTPITFTVVGNDPDSGSPVLPVTLNVSGLPTGATMSPSLGYTGPSPVSSTFTWTPTTANVGAYSMSFTATDNAFQQALTSINITVNILPPVITSPATGYPTTVGSTVPIVGTADPGASVSIFDGASSIGVVTADGSGNFGFNATFASGIHNITAKQTHNAQTSQASNLVAIHVDTQTQITAGPVAGASGASFTFSANLRALPSNVPLAGQTITFTIPGTGTLTGVTDGGGTAAVAALLGTASSGTYSASFAGSAGSFLLPSSTTAPLNISKAATSLTNLIVPAALVGNSLPVSTTLNRVTAPSSPLANASVVFTLTDSSSVSTSLTGTTNAAGQADVTFPAFTARGLYTVAASYAGDSGNAGSNTVITVFNVYQRTSLSFSPPPSATAGASVTLKATLTATPSSTALAGATVQFSFGGAIADQITTTNAGGEAIVSATFPNGGNFPVTASFLDPSGLYTNHTGALPVAPETASTSVSVSRAATSLASLTVPAAGFIGGPSTVSTTLLRVSSPDGPLTGESVVFTLISPSSATSTLTGTTDISGNVSVSFSPGLRGIYAISASFSGNAALLGSTSNSASIPVYQRTSLSVSPVNAIAGGPAVSVTAVLTELPNGVPIGSQVVVFSFGGGMSQMTAITNAAGVAAVNAAFPDAGSYSASATFQNPADFFADRTGAFPVISESSSAVVTVARAAVTITAGSGTATFDGNQKSPGACVVTGAYTGDLTCSNDPATVGPDAGSYTINAVVSGSHLSNFDVTSVAGTATIGQASSSTVITCPTSVVYNGAARTPCNASVTGAGGLSISPTPAYTANVNAGTVTVSYSFTGDNDHAGSSDSKTFEIAKASVTSTAGSGSKAYDGSAHSPSACVVSGAYTGALSCSNSPASAGPGVGSTTINPVTSGAGLANFTVSDVSGTYSITQATSTVTVTCPATVYNGSAQTPCSASYTATDGIHGMLTPSYSNNTNAGTASASASYAGDANHVGSSNSASFAINKAPSSTTVTCSQTSVVYNTMPQTPCSVSVTGIGGLGLTPLPSYSGNTNVGTATASYAYAGDLNHDGSSGSANFAITKAPSAMTVSVPAAIASGGSITISGVLTGVANVPLGGQTVTFSIGSGSSTQTCGAITNPAGFANCSIADVIQPIGPGLAISSAFGGNGNYLGSSAPTTSLVYGYAAGSGGAFVIGDGNSALGTKVTFWGAQWAKLNSVTGGSAPSAFKGFANRSSTTPASTGGTWTTDPGNSSNPPAAIPAYMAVIVSSSVTKSGSTISGNTVKIAIVKTNAGYGPDPGQAGTGTIVAILP